MYINKSEPVIEAHNVSKVYNLWRSSLAPLYVPLARRLERLPLIPGRLRRWCHKKAESGVTPFKALDKVSLTINLGESVAIIGRNGSGKSTLLKILAGTLQPTEGDVQVRGKVAALLELGSGFNPEFTGRENVYLNATVLGLSKRKIDDVYNSILEFSEIGEFIEQPVKTYSSGMLMRLAFSVMTHVDADVLIVDEALAVGDAFFVQKCMRWIADFQTRGTLLFVTHSVGTARGLCSKALWLENGVTQRFDDSKAVTEAYFSRHAVDQPNEALNDSGKIYTESQEVSPYSVLINGPTRARNSEIIVEYPPQSLPSVERGIAEFCGARILGPCGEEAQKFYSSQEVCICLDFHAIENIPSGCAVGFVVKDQLGQSVFGENSWDMEGGSDVDLIPSGTSFSAKFRLHFPTLRAGSYFLDVGLNVHMETTLLRVHDAIHLNVIASDFSHGTLHIPCSQVMISCN